MLTKEQEKEMDAIRRRNEVENIVANLQQFYLDIFVVRGENEIGLYNHWDNDRKTLKAKLMFDACGVVPFIFDAEVKDELKAFLLLSNIDEMYKEAQYDVNKLDLIGVCERLNKVGSELWDMYLWNIYLKKDKAQALSFIYCDQAVNHI